MLSISDPQQTSPQFHQGAQIGQESQHISPQAPTELYGIFNAQRAKIDTFLPWDFSWIFKTVPYWLRESELSLSDSWILQNMMRLANSRVFWLPLQAWKGDKTVLQFHAVGGSTENGLSSPTVLCLKRCFKAQSSPPAPMPGTFPLRALSPAKAPKQKDPIPLKFDKQLPFGRKPHHWTQNWADPMHWVTTDLLPDLLDYFGSQIICSITWHDLSWLPPANLVSEVHPAK